MKVALITDSSAVLHPDLRQSENLFVLDADLAAATKTGIFKGYRREPT